MNSRPSSAACLIAACLMIATLPAFAQDAMQPAQATHSQAVPAPPPPPGQVGGPGHEWGSRDGWDHGNGHAKGMEHYDRREHGFGRGGMHRGGEDLLPMGMWWKNPEVVTRIGLSTGQQKQIEDLFLQSRIQLIHMHASLEEEQLLLEPLLDATPFDEAKALDQINKIADTRADLEKANAKMLLNIRGVLHADQWSKLQDRRPGPHGTRRPDGPHGPEGAWDSGGPQGPPGAE